MANRLSEGVAEKKYIDYSPTSTEQKTINNDISILVWKRNPSIKVGVEEHASHSSTVVSDKKLYGNV